ESPRVHRDRDGHGWHWAKLKPARIKGWPIETPIAFQPIADWGDQRAARSTYDMHSQPADTRPHRSQPAPQGGIASVQRQQTAPCPIHKQERTGLTSAALMFRARPKR